MDNSALENNKNYLPLLSITWQQIAKNLSVAALTCSICKLAADWSIPKESTYGP